MKKLCPLLFLVLIFSNGNIFAQQKTSSTTHSSSSHVLVPPKVVVSKFDEMFKAVSNLKWTTNGEGKYTASFTENEKSCKAFFLSDGTFTEEIITLVPTELPATIVSALKKNYAGKTPSRAQMVKEEDGTVYYGVVLNSKTIRFDPGGKELKDTVSVTH